ncbi:MAG: dephospho-CoA kinase [Muribaculaceae bacterium]|nr:dephospho-CoA kinase [Muribaculaceae bacterium]
MEGRDCRGGRMLIGIAGGIGSGKSVVSRILRLKGFRVYDCDTRAKQLMTESESLRKEIVRIAGDEAYSADGSLNRKFLSECLFSNQEVRRDINLVVHRAVRDDVESFAAATEEDAPVFVESAIMAESGLAESCDAIWLVTAPETVRIDRVMKRNGLSHQEILNRIEAQKKETEKLMGCGKRIVMIENDDNSSLLSQLAKLI